MKIILKKIMQIMVYLVITLNTVFCQEKPKQMKWKYIEKTPFYVKKDSGDTINALIDYNFNQILNYTKDIFFLLGDDNNLYDSISSIIYSTQDFGDTWKKTSLGKGSVKEGVFAGDNLFIVVENNTFTGSLRSFQSSLLLSQDLGNTWQEIKKIEEENIYEINFYSKETGIATFGKEKGNDWIEETRYTVDGGKTWTNFNVLENQFYTNINCVFDSKYEILFISNNRLIKYNLLSGRNKILKNFIPPRGMKTGFISREPKTKELVIYFKGEDNKLVVYFIERNEYIDIPSNYPATSYGDYFYGGFQNTPQPYSSCIWSTDRGKIWHKEKIDNFFIYSPISYYEGYIYTIATVFDGEKEQRGTRLAIGYPIGK